MRKPFKCFLFISLYLFSSTVQIDAIIFQLPYSESPIRQTLLDDKITMLAFIGTKALKYTSKGNIIPSTKYSLYITNNHASVLFKATNGNLILGCDKTHINIFNQAGESISEYRIPTPFSPARDCLLIQGKEANDIYYVYQNSQATSNYACKMTYSGISISKSGLSDVPAPINNSILYCEHLASNDRLFCFNLYDGALWGIFMKFEEGITSPHFAFGGGIIDCKIIKGSGANVIILTIANDQVIGYFAVIQIHVGNISFTKTIMTGIGTSDPLQKISLVKVNDQVLLYCASSKQSFYIHKLNCNNLTEYEPKITMNVGGMFIASTSIGLFDINTYSIILTYTDNTNWIMLFPDVISAVIPLCNDNIDLFAVVDNFPDLLLLNNKDTVNLGLKIQFTYEDPSNPLNFPPIVELNSVIDLMSQIIFNIEGRFRYKYKLSRVSSLSNKYSNECSTTINVCIANCLTCTLQANIPTCIDCQSGLVLNKNQCKTQCNINTSNFYYDNNNDYLCTSTKDCIDYYSYLLNDINQCFAICPVNKQCSRSCLPCSSGLKHSLITCNCLTQSEFNDEILGLGKKLDQYDHSITISFDHTTYEIFDSQSLNNPTSNRANNISTILPGEIDKLKKQCGIPIHKNIIIYKKDYFTQGNLTNDIEYNFYYANGTEIDLDKCEEINIKISIPITNTTSQIYQRAKDLAKLGINPSNPNDPFFNDICFLFETNNKTDIPRKDRANNYLQDNSTLCPSKCQFVNIDYTANKANCSCSQKPIEKKPFDSLKDSFIDSLIDGNWNVVECYQLVFKVTNLMINIGSWFFISLSTVAIGSMIWFCITSFSPFTKHFSKMIISKESIQIEAQNNQKNSQINNSGGITVSAIVIIDKLTKNHKKTDTKQKQYTNDEYSNMEFSELLIKDNRNFLQHYWSFFRTTHPLINAFCTRSTKTLQPIKISLFMTGLVIDFSLSAFFYSDKYISQNYNGNNSFFSDIPVSLYTFLVSLVIGILLNYLTTSEAIVTLIDKEPKLSKKTLLMKKFFDCYKIKIRIYFLIKLVLLVGLWYYTASFCAVYKNSQYDWLISGLKSFGIGQAFPIVITLVLTILLTISLRRSSELVFRVLLFLQLFL